MTSDDLLTSHSAWPRSLDSYPDVWMGNLDHVSVLAYRKVDFPAFPSSTWVHARWIHSRSYPISIMYVSRIPSDSFPYRQILDFYTKHELPFRLALFWMSSNVISIFGSFLAVGVLRMRGVQGKAGWRWLFLVECVTYLGQIKPACLCFPSLF